MDHRVKHEIWDLADTVIAVLFFCSIAFVSLVLIGAIH
jgi:hypothetical protein